MNAAVERTLPVLEEASAFFWESGGNGVLRVQCCDVCGQWQHPPLPLCPSCHSDQVAPQPVSGRGRVRTFTINHQPWVPGMAVPFVFAAIELEEQPELYVLSNVAGPVEEVRSGMPVEVFFEQQEDVWIPLFRPVEEDR